MAQYTCSRQDRPLGLGAVLLVLCFAMMACGGCKSNASSGESPGDDLSDKATSSRKDKKSTSPHTIDTAALTERFEALSGREFSRKPAFSARAVEALEPPPEALPDTLRAEYDLLHGVFVGKPAPKTLDAAPRHTIAYYDAMQDVIVYASKHNNLEELEGALIAAQADAFNHQRASGEKQQPADLDAYISARAVRDGDATFHLLLHALQDGAKPSLAADLANQPELAATSPSAWRAIGEQGFGKDRPLWPMLQAFTHREGMGFVSALHRAQGNGGVALAMQTPPKNSAATISPASWMEGTDRATWSWPKELGESLGKASYSLSGSGQVGAAFTVAWLAHVGQAPWTQLRVVPAAWKADQWQLWQRGEQTYFVWVSQWEAPTAATRIAEILDATLRATHGESKQREWAVMTQGLEVAVVLATTKRDAESPELTEVAKLVTRATPTYPAREGIAIHYVPSHTEALVESASKMTLESNQWSDPYLALKANLGALSDWKVGLDRQGMIRWWAQDKGGDATIQLTAELANPLGPDFGSPGYRDTLEQAMQRSIKDAKIEAREDRDTELGKLLGMRVGGNLQGSERIIQLWHFQRGPHIITLSVNTPASQRARAIKLSSELLTAIDPTGPQIAAPKPNAPAEDSGILEFKVED
ncbi:MAG: hypothetical protein VYE40_04680 [Myxococcota bacterium]|nr:hypothetical protein [Myxococcota bacterium]MEC9440384.1 hypothetical protein [Myxococcota bacterium]